MKEVVRNKKAHREYQILDKLEAGLALRGTEVKSIRAGNVQMGDAYVQIKDDEAWLVKLNISEYAMGSWTNHNPLRRRKLLLHKREIRKLRARIEERGLTVIALRLYLSDRGLVKVEIGVGRGKKLHDKRHDMKRKDMERTIRRELKSG